MAFDKTEYMKQYQKEKLKRVPLNLLPEEYEELKSVCEQSGDSVQGFIKMAIIQRINDYYLDGYAKNPEAEYIYQQETNRTKKNAVPKGYGIFKVIEKQSVRILYDNIKDLADFNITEEELYRTLMKYDVDYDLFKLKELPQNRRKDLSKSIWHMLKQKAGS